MTTAKNLHWFSSMPVDKAEELKLDFAFSLNKVIKDQNLTRKSIAEKMGTSPAWVTKVLRGDVNLTIESMVKLTEAAGVALTIDIKHISVQGLFSQATSKFVPHIFKQATFTGAREASFALPSLANFELTNEPEYADAA